MTPGFRSGRHRSSVITGVAPDALAGEASVERSGIMGIGKPYVRVNTGGVTGSSTFFAGASYIKAGRGAEGVLVFALERMGQATTSQQVFNTIFDPVYEKDFPLTTITMAALRASMLMRLYGYTERHWARDRLQELPERPSQSARPPASRRDTPEDVLRSPLLAWLIHRYEACPMSEGGLRHGALMARGSDRFPEAGVGPGLRIDIGQLRDGRSHSSSQAQRSSISFRCACPPKKRTRKPASRIPSRRSASSSSIRRFPAPRRWPTLLLASARRKTGRDLSRGSLTDPSLPAFNPSGGPQGANPVSATAMVRIAECALQVRGTAGERQVDGVERAVATGQGGATQFSTVCVRGKNPVH